MAKNDNESTAVETRRPWEMLRDELKQRVVLDAGSGAGFDIAAGVIDNIMAATTPDEVFAANAAGPANIEDWLNKPINVWQLTFFKSADKYSEGTLGIYVVIDAFDDQGEECKLSTGAPNVVASMRKLESLGVIKEAEPFRMSIKSRETGNGNLYFAAAA